MKISGVKIERGAIVVDASTYSAMELAVFMRSAILLERAWLAHKASHEATVLAEQLAGLSPKPVNFENIPGCTYCEPQVASVGLTEEAA